MTLRRLLSCPLNAQLWVPAEDRDEARAEEAVRLLATEFIDAGTMGH